MTKFEGNLTYFSSLSIFRNGLRLKIFKSSSHSKNETLPERFQTSLQCHLVGLFRLTVLYGLLQDRNSFTLKLEDTENWLYEDGEDQPKQIYIDKLTELKVSGSYISVRS